MKQCSRCGNAFTPQPGLINYCSLTCRNTRTHSAETKAKISNSINRCYSENSSLIENLRERSTGKKHSIKSKEKISKAIKKMYQDNPQLITLAKELGKRSTISNDGKEKLRRLAVERNFGGHTSKSAIYYETKNGETVYLQSSFELRVAQSLDENNIEWVRPNPLTWTDENLTQHRYYPDFYVPTFDVYLDPKNEYLIQQDFMKIKSVRDQNGVNVLMFGEDHLEWDNLKELLAG